MKSFGLTATCLLEASSVQGVYHAGVAVVLGLLKLKNRDEVYMCQSFTIYFYLVEYTLRNFELLFLLECVELAKIVYHAGVATKYPFKMKFKWLFIFNFDSNAIRVECIRVNFALTAAKVVHHAGVATRMVCELRKLGKKVDKKEVEIRDKVMIKKKKNTNLAFLVGMFQLPERGVDSVCVQMRESFFCTSMGTCRIFPSL